jgi:hypothetical protein
MSEELNGLESLQMAYSAKLRRMKYLKISIFNYKYIRHLTILLFGINRFKVCTLITLTNKRMHQWILKISFTCKAVF